MPVLLGALLGTQCCLSSAIVNWGPTSPCASKDLRDGKQGYQTEVEGAALGPCTLPARIHKLTAADTAPGRSTVHSSSRRAAF
jgi:hypothetical protein